MLVVYSRNIMVEKDQFWMYCECRVYRITRWIKRKRQDYQMDKKKKNNLAREDKRMELLFNKMGRL